MIISNLPSLAWLVRREILKWYEQKSWDGAVVKRCRCELNLMLLDVETLPNHVCHAGCEKEVNCIRITHKQTHVHIHSQCVSSHSLLLPSFWALDG